MELHAALSTTIPLQFMQKTRRLPAGFDFQSGEAC
jgi:hypothetical protein